MLWNSTYIKVNHRPWSSSQHQLKELKLFDTKSQLFRWHASDVESLMTRCKEWLLKAIICSWMTVSSFVYDRMPRIFSHRVKPSTFSSVVTWCFSLITQFRASASLRSIECCIIRSLYWLAPHTPPRRSKALYFFRPGLPDAQYGVDTEMVMTSTCRSDAKRWFYLLKVIN